ncbi:iron complex transport system permease protein [Kushneria sinocarnis]|uniref:Iron complex transport system permease protein n=1 Tax=Kushneria sinocarnis TaxID=595502 RepID=A0A420WT20_9GAMM|nr:iron ABC transporter permease [Kushneria sinocarnis]RKQ95764.1 iron complex transport system permease protein [Kushneria sinocarnis]
MTCSADRDGVPAPAGFRRLGGVVCGREYSLLIDRRAALANLLLLAAVLLVAVLALSLCSITLSPRQALAGLFGTGEAIHVFVVQELRLVRLMAGLATGAAFSLAGCLMQTVARNRLATPGIIGIDNGATAFAVASVVGLGVGLAPPPMALAGAATATVVTFALACDVGTRGYRFIVAGIGVGAVFGALTQLLMMRVAIDVANAAYPWTVGSLNARNSEALRWLLIGLLPGFAVALRLARALTILRFSDAIARGLGYRASACRHAALALSVTLTALAVAVAGPVGLVALIGPEMARRLSSPRGVPLTAAMLAGALLMTLADLVGRLLLAPIEVPVGIVTAIVGAPLLLWMLLRPEARLT